MKEKVIVSGSSLLVSLASYHFAKSNGKDTMTYLMVGGFVGALVGEVLVAAFCNEDSAAKADRKRLYEH